MYTLAHCQEVLSMWRNAPVTPGIQKLDVFAETIGRAPIGPFYI
ncbi:hypothetical protein GCM10010520_68570 [Rhizobium viscosum]